MKDIINFFTEIGKLKGMPRRGWVIRGIENPETIAEHTFRVAIMAWMLGDRKTDKLNLEKLIKIALIHDLCEVYAGDTTPYDTLIAKDGKVDKELFESWPRFSDKERNKMADQKYKKEKKGLEKLIKNLSPKLRHEVMNLWMDYEHGKSKEGRFFKQTDRIESFLQAAEYWSVDKKLPLGSWWMQAKELYDDPTLMDFVDGVEKRFHKTTKTKKSKK